MPGPPPKDEAIRQRRNKTSTHMDLPAEGARDRVKVPALPDDREWHDQTREWWEDLWRSPVAAAFLKVDRHDLLSLAVLWNDFWNASDSSERLRIRSEIRQSNVAFGLSPNDRRRMQWKTPTGEKPITSAPEPVAPKAESGPDPRAMFKVVS